MTTENAPISKDDLEAKFREIKTEVDSVKSAAKSKAVPAGIIGGIVLILLIVLHGRRIGSTRTATVEIRRL